MTTESLAIRPLPQRSRSRSMSHLSTSYRRWVIGAFTLVLLLSFCAQAWRLGGLPVRAVVASALFIFLALRHPTERSRAFGRHRNFLLLTAAVGLLGIVVSVANRMPGVELFRALAEIHIQTAINLMLAALVAEICGIYAVITAFVSVTLLSALFAIAQFAGFQPAWAVRDGIAKLTHETIKYGRGRPPGLSLSTIALPTQLCLALAAMVIGQQKRNEAKGMPKRIDPVVIIAVAVFVFACLAGGNRSPILGGLGFLGLYLVRNKPKLLFVLLPIVVIAVPAFNLLFEYLQSTGLRSFETGDKSSEGRTTLAYYGWLLFKDNPLGYGLGFNPRDHWSDYWRFVQNFPNPVVIRMEELHNYALNMLNYYGVTILVTIPFVIWMLRRYTVILICFIPYITHIAFHNYGPFQNDTFIMFVMAMAAGPRLERVRSRSGSRAAAPAATSNKPPRKPGGRLVVKKRRSVGSRRSRSGGSRGAAS